MQEGVYVNEVKVTNLAVQQQQPEPIGELCDRLGAKCEPLRSCQRDSTPTIHRKLHLRQQQQTRFGYAMLEKPLTDRYSSASYMRFESAGRWSRMSSDARVDWCNCNELFKHPLAASVSPSFFWEPQPSTSRQVGAMPAADARCRPSCWQACCSQQRSSNVSTEVWTPAQLAQPSRSCLLRSQKSSVAQQIHLRASAETSSRATCKYHEINTTSAHQQARQGRKRARRSAACSQQPCCLTSPVSHSSLHFHGRFLAAAASASTDLQAPLKRAGEAATSNSSGASTGSSSSSSSSSNSNSNTGNNNNNNIANNCASHPQCRSRGFFIVSSLQSGSTRARPEKKLFKLVGWDHSPKAPDTPRALSRHQVNPYALADDRLVKRPASAQLTAARVALAGQEARGCARMWPAACKDDEPPATEGQEQETGGGGELGARDESQAPEVKSQPSKLDNCAPCKQRSRAPSRNRSQRLDVISEDERTLSTGSVKSHNDEFGPAEMEELDEECIMFPLELRRPIPELALMCAKSGEADQTVVMLTIESAKSGRQSRPIHVSRAWSSGDLADAIRRELIHMGDAPAPLLDREARSLAHLCNEHLNLYSTVSGRSYGASGAAHSDGERLPSRRPGTPSPGSKLMRLGGCEHEDSASKGKRSRTS